MSCHVERGTLTGMLITIRITDADPIAGVAATDAQDVVPFVGWLGLLRTLSQLLRSGGDVRAPDGFGRQLDA